MADTNNVDTPAIFHIGWPRPDISPLWTSQWSRTHAAETVKTWARLFRNSESVECAQGTLLLRQGQKAQSVFLLTEGLVSLSYMLPTAEEALLGVRFPGEILDYCAHTLQIPYPITARAVTPAKLLRVSADVSRTMERNNPEIAGFFVRLLLIDLCNAATFITELKAMAPADRLEHFLRILANVLGGDSRTNPIRISVPLRDDQMADILGFSARHLKRVKRALRVAGRVAFKSPHIFILSR